MDNPAKMAKTSSETETLLIDEETQMGETSTSNPEQPSYSHNDKAVQAGNSGVPEVLPGLDSMFKVCF